MQYNTLMLLFGTLQFCSFTSNHLCTSKNKDYYRHFVVIFGIKALEWSKKVANQVHFANLHFLSFNLSNIKYIYFTYNYKGVFYIE